MVYKTEYSTRRVYSSDPRPTVTSYSYSYNPIARRRAKPVIISSRVIRTPYPAPLGDQQLLNLITLGGGRAGSVPMIAVQRLSQSPPPRSSTRLHNLYQELEDEMVSNSQGLGAIVPYGRRSVTPMRAVTPVRSMSPSRAFSPGPIRRITYHGQPAEEELREYTPARDYQYGPLVRNRADDVFLHLALGLQPPLYSLHHIPLRSAMDLKEACDVRRQYVHERNMYDPISRLQSDIYRMSFNRAPRRVPTGYVAGNGTLACLTYAGGKPIPKRRRFYPDEELASDYKFNNYYKPSAVGSYYSTSGKKPVYQPIYRSKKSLLGLPDTPRTYKKEVPSYWETRSSNKKSPSPAPMRAPIRKIVAASSPPPTPRAIIPEPENNDTVSFVLRKPRQSVSQEPTTPVEEVPPPVQNLSPDVNVAVKLPRRSVSQEPPIPEPEPEPVEEPAPVEVQVKLRRPSPKPATPEPEPKEPTPPPQAQAQAEPEPEPEPPVVEAPAEVQEEAAPEPEPEAAPAADAVDTSQDVLVEETIIEAEAAPAEAEASPEEATPEAPVAEAEAKGEENLGEDSNDVKPVEELATVEETSVAEVSEAASAPSAEEAAPAPEETSAPAEDSSAAAEEVSLAAEEVSAPVEETTPQADDAAPPSEDAVTISEDVASPAEAAPVAEAPPAEYSLDLQEQDLSEDKNPVDQDEPLDEPEELPLDESEAPEAEDRQDLSEEEEELESED